MVPGEDVGYVRAVGVEVFLTEGLFWWGVVGDPTGPNFIPYEVKEVDIFSFMIGH